MANIPNNYYWLPGDGRLYFPEITDTTPTAIVPGTPQFSSNTIVTGTAAGHYALLDRIRLFVETELPVEQRYVPLRTDDTTDDHESIWRAPGLIGNDSIFFGIKTYQSVASDYYNFAIGGFTGYIPGNTFEYQAGNSGIKGVPLWNNAIDYWLIANGRRIICLTKVENVYESFYLGYCLPYATPGQWPYPLVVGGMLPTASATRYSDISHISWFKGHSKNFTLRTAAGQWLYPNNCPYTTQANYQTDVNGASTYSPDGVYAKKQLRNTINDSDTAVGYYGLHSIVMSDDDNNYGELEGIYYISGFNNAAENIATVNGINYLVYRDVWRTGFNDYVAVRLA